MNHFEPRGDYIYTQFGHEVLDLEHLIGWISEFLAHPAFHKNINVLWDLLDVRDAELSFGDMQTFGDFLLEHRERRGGGRSCLVTDNDLVFGLFRRHEMLNQQKFDYEYRIFRNLQDAQNWITADN